MTNSGNKWPQGAKFLNSANNIISITTKINNILENNSGSNGGSNGETNGETNNFCKIYNEIVNNSSIQLINTYLTEYLNNNYTYLNNVITFDNINTLSQHILALKNSKYPCFNHLLTNYINILESIQNGVFTNSSLQNALSQASQYKGDSEILRNPQLLQEYIDNLNRNIKVIQNINVESIYANIKPEYQKYIELYGVPENLIFDQVKLDTIINEL
jgi:hypothetical protein